MAITKTIIILSIIIGIAIAPSPCNSTSPYNFTTNGTCFIQCPWVPPTQYYGDPVSYTCVTGCSSPSFGFDGNKTCLSTCPSSPNMTYYDHVNRICTTKCPANYYASANQSCLSSCPASTYGNSILWICVSTCPVGTYYANVTIPLCVTICPTNYYASPIDRTCYIGGNCPTSPVRYYADDTTNLCVMICPAGYLADSFSGRCLIYCSLNYFADLATGKCVQTCPSGYYRSSLTRTCLKICTRGYFSDSGSMNCTQHCSTGTYGDSLTGSCNPICTAPNFADPTVSLCVSICSAGLYADNYTQTCVTAVNCYSNTIGDPTTYKCTSAINCPKSPYMFADLTNKICRTKCASSTWGDLTTQTCVSNCPWDASTYVSYKNSLTQQCVTKCPSYPILYADNSTKSCVPTCPQTPQVPFNTYGDATTQSCVTSCPIGYRSDSSTLMCLSFCPLMPIIQFFNPINGTCVSSCPTGFYADLFRQLCTVVCSTSPKYFAFNGNNTCLFTCPAGYYADNSTNNCVTTCPQTTLQYADNSTNYCVTICPQFPSYFGEINLNGNRVCVTTCSVGTFADPVNRTCVSTCNSTLGYYGQLLTPVRSCLIKCPTNQYADNTTSLCVSQCPSFPKLYYGNPSDQTCVLKCPAFLYGNSASNLCVQPANCQSGFFADDYTRLCVKICPLVVNTFGQSTSRKCLQTCPNGTYADSTTRLCSSSCNSTVGLYKDPSTKTCVLKCPSKPNLYADSFSMTCIQTCSNNTFALDATRTCVQICPSTPLYYGNYATYRCVLSCPIQTYSFTNNTFRGCVNICPQRIFSDSYVVDLFADNSTWSCVTLCPQTQNLYSFSHPNNASIRLCVSTCPMVGSTFYFAQNTTQSCATSCPSATLLTYGDIFTSKCVVNCSRNQYRDNTTSRCVYLCSPGYFADNTTQNCVSQCPIGLFGETINRTCAKSCPFNYYADNSTGFCQSLCNNSLFLYSDNTTWKCMNVCTSSPDYYADFNTKLCSKACTGGLFADNFTRSCLLAVNCSNTTLGQPISGRCVTICPIQIPSFLDQSQNLCTTACPAGMYADNSTMICVSRCPSNPDFYAYNSTLLSGICVLLCPIVPTPYYRYSITRQCVLNCPGPSYFKDTNNLQCVTACPPYYYAQIIGQICIPNCNINNKYGYRGVCLTTCPNNTFADNTTFLCVNACPFGYFAQNASCVPTCANGTFADNFTKICSLVCSPDYYAYSPTNQCRQNCQPYFKYFPNQTCNSNCPATANVSTNLYMDNTTYSCINTCLPNWYADNITRSCNQTCTSPLSADNSTGLCVTRCPTAPDYYSYNLICYFPCPANTPALFAQNDTRTCMTICPNGSFADSFYWRCVATCSGVMYGFSNGTVNICVNICTNTTYGNNETKTCVSVCPNTTFGQNTTRLCLKQCPTGSYADSHINMCVTICNGTIPEYSDPSTHSCVPVCPIIPSLYGQFRSAIPVCVLSCQTPEFYTLNTTRLCVDFCVFPFFADPISGTCAYKCPINYNYYADNSTRVCKSSCPNVTINSTVFLTYADDSTKACVFVCPFSPSLYGDNSTNKCVKKCPAFSYGDNNTRICLQTCFFGILFNSQLIQTFADNTTNFCVAVCPANSWADNFTYTCVTQCTQGTFADDSTWKCVRMCPVNPISYAYTITRQCLYACPGNYLASEVGRQCLFKSCPTIPYFYYKDFLNNECVLKCVYPYFGEITSQSCVSTCSYGFFENLGAMTCTQCPTSCLTCLNSQNCTSCQYNLYLFEGQCLTNCPTFPIYYYKYSPSFACIEVCPPPYFGFNGTGTCQNTCPITFFSNTTSNTCQACPNGCSTCYGTDCSNCMNGYVYVPKYSSCSLKCSLSNQYFLNGGCVSSCPSGTFLLDDLVTCQNCNPICSQCFNVANNCTKCQGAFWYNYNCVAQCPSNYYVDSNNFCQKCSNNPSACAVSSLSYTLGTKTINYKLYAICTFNRPVNLTQSQFAKIAMLQTKKGPLKSSQYSVTQTSPTTYQISFLDSGSLNQLSLSLSFTPGSISDLSGNGLTSMSSTTQVATISTVSPQMQEQAQSLSNKVNVLSYVLVVVLLLMMIKCSYPMIVLIDMLQLIHMHIYVLAVPLPYLFMQVLSALKNVNFAFLPALYTLPNPDQNGVYYAFQPDTTFLGNCQPFVIFLSVFGGTYLLFWLLSMKKINCWVWLRRKAKSIFNERMRFSFLHEIFYYTGYYVLFFALYQFTGSNASIDKANTNLAAAIIVVICYTVWFIMVTYVAVKYSKKLESMPKKFKFLVYEDSQFPMQIPMRCLTKFVVGCILIAPTAATQLILLMVFNLVYIIYTLFYSPSKNKATNLLNTIIHLFMIAYEIVLFLYSISDMNSDYQTTISNTLISLLGVLVILVILWMVYRLIMHIRTQCFGYKPPLDESIKEQADSNVKINYEKIHSSNKILSDVKDKEMLNFSQLNFKDEQDQFSDAQSINVEEAMQQFTYHFVPKKTEAMIKHENELIGIKEQKKGKRNGPLVIQIDQDELLEQNEAPSTQKTSELRSSQIKRRIKSGAKNIRDHHLRIEDNDSHRDIEEVRIQPQPTSQHSPQPAPAPLPEQQSISSLSYLQRRRLRKQQATKLKQKQPENRVVWDNLGEELRSREEQLDSRQ